MAPASILIVEDELIIAMELQDRMLHMGHTVLALAASGAEAIAKARALKPELVLMDIRLPGVMDGIEAAQQIRAQLQIPVVYVTAYPDTLTVERLRTTEPTFCVPKPFDEHQLQSTIEQALRRHSQKQG
jgi:CheY-like chemotaxis protein